MSEDPNKKQDPKNPDPKDPEKDPKGEGEVDLSKLSDEQLAKVLEDPRIWKTQRLSELREDSKAFKTLKAKQDQAEKEKLEAEGKTTELLEKTKGELESAKQKLADQARRMEIQRVASSLGVKDVEAAEKLIDSNGIKVDEDGNITGVDEAMKALVEKRPFLVDPSSKEVGNPSNPGGNTPEAGTFKMTQLQDPKFYQENRDAIMKAQSEGRIEDDRQFAGQAGAK